MPTIVLRKIDEDIKGITEHSIIDVHQIKVEEPKLEVVDADQLCEIQSAELVQLLHQHHHHHHRHHNQVGATAPNDDVFIEHHEPPPIMLMDTCQVMEDEVAGTEFVAPEPPPAQLYQPASIDHHIACSTVAFPIYLLLKGGDSDESKGQLMKNMLQLQNFLPIVRDTYCDIFSKFEHNILNDATNIFPSLTTVDNHDHDKLRFDDHHNRSIKSMMYPALPKPSHVNTFGMRRIGGGATISRRSFYLRKTLLKNRESDKKLKLKVNIFFNN